MVLYINCKICGKVVDEYEDRCYWCGEKSELNDLEKKESEKKDE